MLEIDVQKTDDFSTEVFPKQNDAWLQVQLAGQSIKSSNQNRVTKSKASSCLHAYNAIDFLDYTQLQVSEIKSKSSVECEFQIIPDIIQTMFKSST